MAIQITQAVKNAMLDAIETAIGTAAVLKIRTLAPPTNITDADTGLVLATFSLESDWMTGATAGTKAKLGTWSDTAADTSGTAAHFRIYASNGTTQHIQGTVGQGSGDLSLDSTTVVQGQTVTITAFTLVAGN